MFTVLVVFTRRGRIRVRRPRVSARNHNQDEKERGCYLRVPDVNCLHGAERWGQLFRLATWQTLR